MCGSGLRAGETSDYVLTGAEMNAGGVLLVSVDGFANVPVLLGTLVSFDGFLLQSPLLANASGEVTIPLAGNALVADLVFQSVMFDSTTPTGLVFSNALLVQYGR